MADAEAEMKDQIAKLDLLKEADLLTDEEYQQRKSACIDTYVLEGNTGDENEDDDDEDRTTAENEDNASETPAQDWICQSCGAPNYGHRSTCYQCGAPPPLAAAGGAAAAGVMDMNNFPGNPMANRFHPYGQMGGMGGPMAAMGAGGRGGRGGNVGDGKTVKAQPIDVNTTEEQLRQAFKQFGTVISVKVMAQGMPAYGYINFDTADSVQAAVNAKSVLVGSTPSFVTAKLPMGAAMIGGGMGMPGMGMGMSGMGMGMPGMGMGMPGMGMGMPGMGMGMGMMPMAMCGMGMMGMGMGGGGFGTAATNGIGMFNLPLTTTETELWDILKPYNVQSVKLVTDKDVGFKGFAFAYFKDTDEATTAKESLQGLTMGSNHVDVKFAMRPREAAWRGRGNKPKY